MPRPRKPKFEVPATPPDADKLERSTSDGFVSRGDDQKQRPLLIDDDARIIQMFRRERYARDDEPIGVELWIWSL